MNLGTVVLLMACVASSGHEGSVQASVERKSVDSQGRPDAVKLLQLLSPAAAWSNPGAALLHTGHPQRPVHSYPIHQRLSSTPRLSTVVEATQVQEWESLVAEAQAAVQKAMSKAQEAAAAQQAAEKKAAKAWWGKTAHKVKSAAESRKVKTQDAAEKKAAEEWWGKIAQKVNSAVKSRRVKTSEEDLARVDDEGKLTQLDQRVRNLAPGVADVFSGYAGRIGKLNAVVNDMEAEMAKQSGEISELLDDISGLRVAIAKAKAGTLIKNEARPPSSSEESGDDVSKRQAYSMEVKPIEDLEDTAAEEMEQSEKVHPEDQVGSWYDAGIRLNSEVPCEKVDMEASTPPSALPRQNKASAQSSLAAVLISTTLFVGLDVALFDAHNVLESAILGTITALSQVDQWVQPTTGDVSSGVVTDVILPTPSAVDNLMEENTPSPDVKEEVLREAAERKATKMAATAAAEAARRKAERKAYKDTAAADAEEKARLVWLERVRERQVATRKVESDDALTEVTARLLAVAEVAEEEARADWIEKVRERQAA